MFDFNLNLWVRAIGSTFLVSTAPLLILFLIPVQTGLQTKKSEALWKVLLSFASGGLLGDAFLHLIPHALNAKLNTSSDSAIKSVKSSTTSAHYHGHSHGIDYGNHVHDITVGLYVLSGIVTFLVIEKVIRILKGEEDGDYDNKTFTDEVILRKKFDEDKKGERCHLSRSGDIKVAGYLNLAADFTHNVTDGLAIGASFLAGDSFGLVTTLTVLLHEIPHEVGDFAILVQSGCTKQNAIKLQLVTALGTVLGCCISFLTADALTLAEVAAASWVLPFTAGGYIYVATVSVIPELLEECDNFWQIFKETCAMLIGIYMMVVIANLE